MKVLSILCVGVATCAKATEHPSDKMAMKMPLKVFFIVFKLGFELYFSQSYEFFWLLCTKCIFCNTDSEFVCIG